MNKKRVINIFGNILMLLSIAFIINRIIEYRIDFSEVLSVWPIIIIAILIIIYALVVVALANVYYAFLRLLSCKNISRKDTVFVYCKSNMYKYLPGNVFHYIGRNQISLNERIPHGTVIAATLAEMLLLTFAAAFTAAGLAGLYAVRWLVDNYTHREMAILVISILLAILAIITLYRAKSKAREWIVEKSTQINRIPFTVTIRFSIIYTVTFILNGAMFIMALYSIGGEISNNLILPVIGMYTLSWIVGFLTPGAPAGLGIREAIMSTLLIGIVEAELVITAVLLYRIATIMGDVVAFLMVGGARVASGVSTEQ